MDWKSRLAMAGLLAGMLSFVAMNLDAKAKARQAGRVEACEWVCGGDAEWATVGEGCVCVIREEVRRGRMDD